MSRPMAIRKSPREIRALARGLVTGEFWGTTDPYEVDLSFGLVLAAFMSEADPATLRSLENVAFVYAPLQNALPRSINGLPMFMQARFVHVNDMPHLAREVNRMQEALNA